MRHNAHKNYRSPWKQTIAFERVEMCLSLWPIFVALNFSVGWLHVWMFHCTFFVALWEEPTPSLWQMNWTGARKESSTECLCELSMRINYSARGSQNSFDCPLWVFSDIYYSLYTTFFLFFSQIYSWWGLVLLTCIVAVAAFCEQEAVAVETGQHQSFKRFSKASERDRSCRTKCVCWLIDNSGSEHCDVLHTFHWSTHILGVIRLSFVFVHVGTLGCFNFSEPVWLQCLLSSLANLSSMASVTRCSEQTSVSWRLFLLKTGILRSNNVVISDVKRARTLSVDQKEDVFL